MIKDKNLKRIDLSNKNINDKYMEGFCLMLTSSKFQIVKSLNFRNNQIKAEGVKHLVDHVPDEIKELILQDNPLGPEGGAILKPLCSNIYYKYSGLSIYWIRIVSKFLMWKTPDSKTTGHARSSKDWRRA